MKIDHFFTKQYNRSNYNCAHFVSEVWYYLTMQDISFALYSIIGENKVILSELKSFYKLKTPITPCIAVYHSLQSMIHVGVYLDNKILHINEGGVEHQRLEIMMINYKRVNYYGIKSTNYH